MEIPNHPGIYVVIGLLSDKIQLQISSLGNMLFFPGVYCYCGSACGPGGLRARVGRHLNAHTKKFWHFDYLKVHLQIVQVWWQPGENVKECAAAQFLAGEPDALIPANGFGSSDCSEGCASHLIYFSALPSLEVKLRKLNKNGFNFKRKMIQHMEIG